MYDCENGIIYELRWDDNIGCEGEPTTNSTDGTCTDPLLCNCVPAEESDCSYIEYKIYPSSSCSGEYSSNSQVLNECYKSYDGQGSFKLDCEPDTLIETSYSNTNCDGSGTSVDLYFTSKTPCVKVTCKSGANMNRIGFLLVYVMIVSIAACLH